MHGVAGLGSPSERHAPSIRHLPEAIAWEHPVAASHEYTTHAVVPEQSVSVCLGHDATAHADPE
jgi:hypothetical protein